MSGRWRAARITPLSGSCNPDPPSVAPAADDCAHRHFCKYATRMVLDGAGQDHDCLPRPAYIALARLPRSLASRRCPACASAVPPSRPTWCAMCPTLHACALAAARACPIRSTTSCLAAAVSEIIAAFLADLPLADPDLAALMAAGVSDGGRFTAYEGVSLHHYIERRHWPAGQVSHGIKSAPLGAYVHNNNY